MKKLFPMMLDAPETKSLVCSIPYWILCFFIFPFLLNFATITHRGQPYEIWLEMGYHLLNFVLILFFFFTYLKDAFLMLQVHTGVILKTAAFCALGAVLLKIGFFSLAMFNKNVQFINAAFGSFLITESDLLFYSTGVIYEQPVWGTLCISLLAPVTVSCLLYASVFAPICTSRPWLAYLVMAGLLLLIRLSFAFCVWPMEEEMAIYLVQLPVHMLACWSYQKTDTVWTPILMHGFSNMIMTPFIMSLMGIV